MKWLLISLLATIAVKANAQNNILLPNPRERTPAPLIVFIDSVKMDSNSGMNYLSWLDPNDILNIFVKKDKVYQQGAIYITLKKHNTLVDLLKDKRMSLNDILIANLSENKGNKSILYFIDEKLITDTLGVRIPSKYVKKVTIIKAEEMPYFKSAFPDTILMMISTKPPVVYIR
ncbi:hypothetical protein IDJ75_19685 [Mucilaginibacter rigui]|uniref:Uncharacterized protein n=1 Tax=Mucilaginibacter rigui TaxID=534635 RepID=A0ABR7XAA2_9SPHI|nr:hypothetical protein [Mucilaginibacter rigui]MBD1387516.1 hypothetical protein [Mucilaginibacter rigui]